MKTILYMGHPAHFHLLKHTYQELVRKKNEVRVVIKSKDILEDLLKNSNIPYLNILPKRRKRQNLDIIKSEAIKFKNLNLICREFEPDLMFGTCTVMPYVGRLNKVTSIMLTEDDYKIVRKFAIMTYPVTNVILSPSSCDNGHWKNKTIGYNGYHKLAYLHPRRFFPDKNIVAKYIDDFPYAIVRFSKLDSYHDVGIKGFSNMMANKLIEALSRKVKVYISSERELPQGLNNFRLRIDPLDIHHVLAHASLFVGDSQSMTVESAMLGTPSIRFSSFVGRIGVLEELEKKYGLTFGVLPTNPHKLFNLIEVLLANKDIKDEFAKRRLVMLNDKIDVTAFYVWFIDNYPESLHMMRRDSKCQYVL